MAVQSRPKRWCGSIKAVARDDLKQERNHLQKSPIVDRKKFCCSRPWPTKPTTTLKPS
jgi:hypothetical protein